MCRVPWPVPEPTGLQGAAQDGAQDGAQEGYVNLRRLQPGALLRRDESTYSEWFRGGAP